MPRSASQSPDDALQGNLFGAPKQATPAAPASEAARLAGVPKPVVQRARQVLDQLAA